MLKRLCCFLSLLLSLCLLFPVFSVSTSAISVDGYNVSTRVLNESGAYEEFTDTIVFDTSANRLIIMVTIELSEIIPKDTLFDLEVEFSIGDYLTISEYNGGGSMYDSNWIQIDGKLDGIVKDGKLIESQIVALGDIKYIRYVFDIYNPIWIEVDLSSYLINFSLDKITNTVQAVKGMTWDEWCNSDFNTFGAFCDNANQVIFPAYFFPEYYYSSYKLYYDNNLIVRSYDQLIEDYVYSVQPIGGTQGGTNDGFGPDIEDPGASYSMSSSTNGIVSASLVEYQFQFSVSSVSITQYEDTEDTSGILGWFKNIFNAILDIPNKLADLIKGLFIPSEEAIIELKDKFEALFADRFGAAYQSIEVVEQFGQAMGISTYSDTVDTITFPSVTVPLAGTEFTFGGWEVDLVPKGFEGLITPLKLIVDLVCTIACVNMFRRRMEGVLR